MEIEVVLERLIRWFDMWLSDPNGVKTADDLLSQVDHWLQDDIARRQSGNQSPQSPMAGQTWSGTEQSVNPVTGRAAPLAPRGLRGKQSSTQGMVE